MAKVKVELLSDGIADLLNCDGVAGECRKAASKIAGAAGSGFEVTPSWRAGFGGGRVAYSVKTGTRKARIAEAKEKALSKAVFSCR